MINLSAPFAGVLQEKMAIKKYGLLGARFPHLNALVGVQSMACFLWAGLLLLVFPPTKGSKVAPITAYWLPGLTNSVGPALGFQALKNISYPAQASDVCVGCETIAASVVIWRTIHQQGSIPYPDPALVLTCP